MGASAVANVRLCLVVTWLGAVGAVVGIRMVWIRTVVAVLSVSVSVVDVWVIGIECRSADVGVLEVEPWVCAPVATMTLGCPDCAVG